MMKWVTYLHEGLRSVEEVLPTLRLGAFLVPVDDRLVRDTILVVQNLLQPRIEVNFLFT